MAESLVLRHGKSQGRAELYVDRPFPVLVQRKRITGRDTQAIHLPLTAFLAEFERICAAIDIGTDIICPPGMPCIILQELFPDPVAHCQLVISPPVVAELRTDFEDIEHHRRCVIVRGIPVIPGIEADGHPVEDRPRKIIFYSEIGNCEKPLQRVGPE